MKNINSYTSVSEYNNQKVYFELNKNPKTICPNIFNYKNSTVHLSNAPWFLESLRETSLNWENPEKDMFCRFPDFFIFVFDFLQKENKENPLALEQTLYFKNFKIECTEMSNWKFDILWFIYISITRISDKKRKYMNFLIWEEGDFKYTNK